jgi:predicted nucleic acid-binding protein
MKHHGNELDALSRLVREYADRGVELPDDLLAHLEQRISPFVLADLEKGSSATRLVGAWRATRSAPRSPDEVWIILLRLFQERFDGFTPGLKEALGEHHMGIANTRIQIRLQLGSRCFHLGRRLVAQDTESATGSFLLQECAEVLAGVARTENRLPADKRRMYRGQLATALVILSRRSPADAVVDVLRQADEHSRVAEEHGDRTEEHFAYQAEIGLRLHNATRDQVHLANAQRSITALPVIRTKRLRSVAADVVAARGYAQITGKEVADGVSLLREAESGYAEALTLVETDGVDDGYLLAKRGLLRNQLYRTAVDPHGRRDSALLDSALADWLDPRASAHSHDTLVANALLDRARIRARRNDLDGASADRERARALLPPGTSSQTDLKLLAAELEHALDEANAADDLHLLRRLVEEANQLPPDAVIPAAALARACKILVRVSDDEEWRPPLADAVSRLEMDLAHPSMTAPAIRAIAGHAALLSWFLARRGKDRDLLGRTVQLYRTSFDAMANTPSVDALSNASTCALALGKSLLAGDEADSEEAAGLFADGGSWLRLAFQRAAGAPATVRGDFSPLMAHSRLGEIALRAYPLTWNQALLDTAIEHLGTARDLLDRATEHLGAAHDLGENAVALTGLLGDAHYRRGSRRNDVGDLERAVNLKDDAFASGASERENRSLAAAATIKLFGLTGDAQLLTDATLRALQAVRCDPSWPWAVIQLADLAGSAPDLDVPTVSAAEPRELAAWVSGGHRDELLRHAAELAVHTEEFSASILGGQQRSGERGVRVLNDPHRLIEQALVLKRLARVDAHRERDETTAFSQWLASTSAPAEWTLPRPLAVVDLTDDDSVYVMQRAQGRVLGASVVEWREHGGVDPRPRFREALRYLAAFQAWRAASDDGFPRTCGWLERSAFQAQLEKVGRKLDPDEKTRTLLARLCADFVTDGMSAVAKKDPHPDNWLWTSRGQLVLIDVESTGALPLFQEAVTIIDDLPLFDLTDHGWEDRSALCRVYVDALHDFGFPQVEERFPVMEHYEAMATLHAIKGLARLLTADPGVSSYSLEARRMQGGHYRNLLTHLSERAVRAEVRELARRIDL